MSYDSWKTTEPYDPWNEAQSEADAREDEHRSPCGCGDPSCWIDDRDETNIKRGGKWWTADCANSDPVIAAEREEASRADVARDDDFNRFRR